MIFLISGQILVWAQDFRVTVHNDQNEPLPYAYIHINGRVTTISDSTGNVVLDANRLLPGDTLSASYVGTENAQVIYDEELKAGGKYTFILSEIYQSLTAEEVTVRIDIVDLLRKHLRHSFSIFYNNRLRAPFGWKNGGAGPERKIEGEFTAEMKGIENPNTGTVSKFYQKPLKITTPDDMTGVSDRIQSDIISSLELMRYWNSLFNSIKFRPKQFKANAKEWKLAYRGRKDGDHIFRLSYPQEDGTAQCLAFVSEDSKRIRRIEWHSYVPAQERETRFEIDYQLYADKRPIPKPLRWESVAVFKSMTLTYRNPEMGHTQLRAWDPVIRVLKRDKKLKKESGEALYIEEDYEETT